MALLDERIAAATEEGVSAQMKTDLAELPRAVLSAMVERIEGPDILPAAIQLAEEKVDKNVPRLSSADMKIMIKTVGDMQVIEAMQMFAVAKSMLGTGDGRLAFMDVEDQFSWVLEQSVDTTLTVLARRASGKMSGGGGGPEKLLDRVAVSEMGEVLGVLLAYRDSALCGKKRWSEAEEELLDSREASGEAAGRSQSREAEELLDSRGALGGAAGRSQSREAERAGDASLLIRRKSWTRALMRRKSWTRRRRRCRTVAALQEELPLRPPQILKKLSPRVGNEVKLQEEPMSSRPASTIRRRA